MEPAELIVPRQRALKHVQVREHVRGLIEAQPPGSAAPSERELVARFGVARMTVRQALDLGSAVLPVLAKSYWKQALAVLVVLVLLRRLLRRS